MRYRSQSKSAGRASRAVRLGLTAALVATLASACKNMTGEIPYVPSPPEPKSETELVVALHDAYAAKSIIHFDALFDAGFDFRSTASVPTIRPIWCRPDWICAHQRMFALPPDSAFAHVDLSVAVATTDSFAERPEFYQSPANPGGLDRTHWRVTGITAAVAMVFQTQGDTNYRVSGMADLVVANDRSKTAGDAGKYAFHRITDTGAGLWTQVLRTYGAQCLTCPVAVAETARVEAGAP